MAAAMFSRISSTNFNQYSKTLKRKRNNVIESENERSNSNKKTRNDKIDIDVSSNKEAIENIPQLQDMLNELQIQNQPTSVKCESPQKEKIEHSVPQHSSTDESSSESGSVSEENSFRQKKKFVKHITIIMGKSMSKTDMENLDTDIVKLNDVDMSRLLLIIQEREPAGFSNGDIEINFENFKYMTLKVMKTFVASCLRNKDSTSKRRNCKTEKKDSGWIADCSSSDSDQNEI